MAERRIEHPSPAVRLRPCKREIAVGPPVVRVGRHLRRVEAEQDAELVAGERLRLVKLVGQRENGWEMARGWKRRIFVDNCSARRVPRMIVVPRPEQLAKLRPRLERRERRMGRHQSFALVVDEGGKLGSLSGIERDFSMSQKENCVDIGQAGTAAGRGACRHQRLLRDDVRIGADVCVVRTGLVAEPLDDR